MEYLTVTPTAAPKTTRPLTQRLDLLIGQAVVSDSFRAGLMNGQRAKLLAEWHLEADETAKIMDIRADSFEAFAQGVCQILGEAISDAHRTGTQSRLCQ